MYVYTWKSSYWTNRIALLNITEYNNLLYLTEIQITIKIYGADIDVLRQFKVVYYHISKFV